MKRAADVASWAAPAAVVGRHADQSTKTAVAVVVAVVLAVVVATVSVS